MKALKIIPIIILAATITYAQTINIGTGAEINLGSGVDLCSSVYGNITGNVTGTGTQCNSPMPVEMMTFSGSVNKTSIMLAWQTSSEINNKGFEIYRSGKNTNTDWVNVGFVNGNGTKTTPTNYTYSDNKLSTGKYYYRIKQVDFNGNFQYFNLNSFIEIAGPTKYELSQNYPNPFNPVTKINFSLSTATTVSLKVYDMSGREVSTLINNKFLTADYYSLEFDASKLASGVYVYKIVTEKFTSVKKMVVLK